jgi:hypothetical protein
MWAGIDPLHARGGHKARIVAAALGYRRIDDARWIGQVREGILRHEAVLHRDSTVGAR